VVVVLCDSVVVVVDAAYVEQEVIVVTEVELVDVDVIVVTEITEVVDVEVVV